MLRDANAREALRDRLRKVDRLVLLGDVLELRQARLHDVLQEATPVLAEIGRALGADSEVLIVPGNHDHHLLSGWLERRSAAATRTPLGSKAAVDWWSGEVLASVCEALAPASVRASYPGAWLRSDVYATHGHYLDRHTTVPMFERLGAGTMARIVGERATGPASAEEYEAVLAPMYAWIHAIAQSGGPQLGRSSHGASGHAWRTLTDAGHKRSVRRRALQTGFPALVALLSRTPLGPLRADISGSELRRAALRAMGEVVARLKIDAAHVIFGHTHRAGPLPRDAREEWRAGHRARLINSGSWVHEVAFLGSRPQDSPYRPGFAVTISDEDEPQLTNLLDARVRA